MRRIGVGERRARLARRHHLAAAARAGGVVEVAGDLVGLHATDPASVVLAAAARTRAADPAAVGRALYQDRTLVRVPAMRRTLFVVPLDLAGILAAACGRPAAAQLRRRLIRLLATAGVAGDPAGWLADVEAATVRALAARGEATASELLADEPRLRARILTGVGDRDLARQGIWPLVLGLLAADLRIVRGRPRGSWTSGQYRWAVTEAWLPDQPAGWETDAARAELARRWLAGFGPGTAADLRWWTGWTAGQVARALQAVGAVEVDLDGVTGLVLPDDLGPPPPAAEPWAALLPALDPTVMGWAERRFLLGRHGPALFDRNGNAGPTVWWDGRVVGGWGQLRDGRVAVRLLEDVGADAAAAVEAAADRLAAWLGPTRVTPRFRTPLERELTA
jgi:Winged helix DNA-binding domain